MQYYILCFASCKSSKAVVLDEFSAQLCRSLPSYSPVCLLQGPAAVADKQYALQCSSPPDFALFCRVMPVVNTGSYCRIAA